ncbi:MAG: hypothetical protein ACRBBW_11905 [Cellvibrionaceae bacterium]
MKKSTESTLSLIIVCALAALLGSVFKLLLGFEFSGIGWIIYFALAFFISMNEDNLIEATVVTAIITPIFFGLWHQYSGYLIRKHELESDSTFLLSHGAESLVAAMIAIVSAKLLFAIAKTLRRY